jgi:hypothetical protein
MQAPSQPRDRDRIDGIDLWEIEIAFYVEYLRMEPERARFRTIMRWADAGDLRPLWAAIAKAQPISAKAVAVDAASFVCLKELLAQDRLLIKSRRSNRPPSPERFAPLRSASSLGSTGEDRRRFRECFGRS